MVEPKTFYPLFAMYSDKWDSVDELPDGATIGLCNDATNQARGLHLLESQGLITLDDSVSSFPIKKGEFLIIRGPSGSGKTR